ncbi:hypothetical protein DFP94_101478 [Fontibacillus phaseoli]|uniref:Uncharacterized protein n=1 Tax=Fontibacillus phaseoli TaxID=1416533 RepID=A0A369BMR0_9BACL|nr:hypothetical protein [Fontibacillus phaseoli]RCX22889.1 hypothetical protein DFP94_101478 [Fontibacillus phaseoli]
MDWNAFFGALTWCSAILSTIGAICFGAFSIDEKDGAIQRFRVVCAASCGLCAVLSVATIAGMGWGPQ